MADGRKAAGSSGGTGTGLRGQDTCTVTVLLLRDGQSPRGRGSPHTAMQLVHDRARGLWVPRPWTLGKRRRSETILLPLPM